jgi:hypothetical protein
MARELNAAMDRAGLSYVEPGAAHEPVAFHLWRSGGIVHVLLGNLETGVFGDARSPRTVTVVLRRRHLGLGEGEYSLREIVDGAKIMPVWADETELGFVLNIEPENSAIYQLNG